MRASLNLTIVTLVLLASCSRESRELELNNPGFGVMATTIDAQAEGVDLPIHIKSDEVIKGIQYTMVWDPSVGQVMQPQLTEANSDFTISSTDGLGGKMKVLIFSMTGVELNMEESSIMNIPVRILDPEATDFTIIFEDVIFAGPNASSYSIPISHANLEIIRK